jgi:hypothetical protein
MLSVPACRIRAAASRATDSESSPTINSGVGMYTRSEGVSGTMARIIIAGYVESPTPHIGAFSRPPTSWSSALRRQIPEKSPSKAGTTTNLAVLPGASVSITRRIPNSGGTLLSFSEGRGSGGPPRLTQRPGSFLISSSTMLRTVPARERANHVVNCDTYVFVDPRFHSSPWLRNWRMVYWSFTHAEVGSSDLSPLDVPCLGVRTAGSKARASFGNYPGVPGILLTFVALYFASTEVIRSLPIGGDSNHVRVHSIKDPGRRTIELKPLRTFFNAHRTARCRHH